MSSLAAASPPTSAHLISGILTAFSPKALLSFSISANFFITSSPFDLLILINMLLISLNVFPWRYLAISDMSTLTSFYFSLLSWLISQEIMLYLSAFSGFLMTNFSLNSRLNVSSRSDCFSHVANKTTHEDLFDDILPSRLDRECWKVWRNLISVKSLLLLLLPWLN